MKARLIGIGVVLLVMVIAGAICSSSINGSLDASSHTLDSMALLKSMDVMNNQISVIDKMTNIITFQNVAFMVGGLLVLFIAVIIFRSNNSGKNNNQPIIIQQGNQEASYPTLPSGMPRYIAFGPAGINYIRRLPKPMQEDVLNELYNITAEVERMTGRSHAVVQYDRGGKVKGQRFS